MLSFKSHSEVEGFSLLVHDLVAAPFYTLRTFDFLAPILRDYHFDELKFQEQVSKAAYPRLHVHVERTAPTLLVLRDEDVEYAAVIVPNFKSIAGSNTKPRADVDFDVGDARAQIASGVRYHDYSLTLPLFTSDFVYGSSEVTPDRKDWRLPIAGANPFGIAVDPQYPSFVPFVFLAGTGSQTQTVITGGIGTVITATITSVP